MKKFLPVAVKAAFILSFMCFASSCEVFEFNPNQIILDDDQKGLTRKNMGMIRTIPPPDTLKFIFMGDTQRFYDDSDDFVKSANQFDDVSFAIHAGDISDFGLVKEFKWVNDIMAGLTVPYLTVIGNHDLLANGRKGYYEMFGDYNYTFEYGPNRFIFLNTNSREFEFDGTVPDLDWLQNQLADNPENKNTIIISHIPPFDADYDPDLELAYANLLAKDKNVKLSLHGHQHAFNDGEFYDDGVRYFVTTSMNKRGYALVSVWDSGFDIKRIEY